MFEQWQELHLTVVELPIEFVDEKIVHAGYLREIPCIASEASSKKALHRQLLEQYQEYVESQLPEESTEEMTSSLLSVDQLMKYYDGEVFDGFELNLEEE